MNLRYKAITTAAVPLSALWLCFPAYAQQTASPAAALEQDKSSAPEGLEDIVVTATRRSERLQDVPVSVTAVDARGLELSGVKDIRSLTQLVPGYTGGRAVSVMQPNIRGVGSLGNSIGDESNVATYVDGIYLADPFSTQVDLVAIERVEVLKGPQGTVFGRNATGGLINVITADPSHTVGGHITVSGSRMRNDDTAYDIRAYLTGPISSNLAANVSLLHKNDSGYVRDLVKGGTFDGQRVTQGRIKLLYEPSTSARIRLIVGYTDLYSQIPNQPYLGRAASRATPGVILATQPNTGALDYKPESKFDRLEIGLQGLFDLGPFSFESNTAFVQAHDTQRVDTDATNIPLAFSILDNAKTTVYTQEFRLLSNDSKPLNWTAGVFAFHFDGDMPYTIGNVIAGKTVLTAYWPRLTTESLAAFAQGTYELGDRFYVTLGGRYTTETRYIRQNINGVDPFGRVHVTFNKFTYNTALRYEISDRANIYATFGTGFKSGVYNAISRSRTPVLPEEIKALEAGIKSDLATWLRFNIAGYRYWYDNLQVNARAADGSYVLQNAAKAKIYGAEVSVTLKPTSKLTITSGASYNNAKYAKFFDAQSFTPLPTGGNATFAGDASGKDLVRSPRYSVTASVDYRVPLSSGTVFAGGNVLHSARVYHDFLNTDSQGPYTLLSLQAGWSSQGDRLTATLFVKNLTDAEVHSAIRENSVGTYTYYEPPREVGVSLKYAF